MRKVSIIIPVIRPEGAARCIDAIHKNAGIVGSCFEILAVEDVDGIGCPEMVKKLTGMAQYDLVCFLGDDTIPQKDFLLKAIWHMSRLPDGWGMVGLNSGGNDHAHWLADKRLLDHIPGGDFFSTEYMHCYGDDEMKDIATDLGRFVYAEDAVIEHRHPVFGTAEVDEGYCKAYSEKAKKHDRLTYQRRKTERIRKRDGLRLGIAWPVTNSLVYARFAMSFTLLKKPSFHFFVPEIARQVDVNGNMAPNIDKIRDNIVDQALMAGCTHLLTMDTDQVYYTADMIERMLNHEKEVVAAKVHRRYPPFDPIMLKGNFNEDSVKSYQAMSYREICNATENGDLVEVDNIGCGCVLYDTRVFFKVKPPWYEPFKWAGEDISFHAKLREEGVRIYVDTAIDVRHLSTEEIGMEKFRLFHKLQERGKDNGR